MRNKAVGKVLISGVLLCFVIMLPSFAYSFLGFFIASPETFVPSSDFISTDRVNMRTCASKWNNAAGETILTASTSVHNSTNFAGGDGDGLNYVYYMNDGSEYLGLCRHLAPNGYLVEFDININSHYYWNASSGYDLYSVFLHETGHAAGLNHSIDTDAVMYHSFSVGEIRRTLNSDDNEGMQSIYYWNW